MRVSDGKGVTVIVTCEIQGACQASSVFEALIRKHEKKSRVRRKCVEEKSTGK